MTGFFVAPVPEWQHRIRARCEEAGHRRLAIDGAENNSTIPERFQRVVAQVPDRPAIVTAQREFQIVEDAGSRLPITHSASSGTTGRLKGVMRSHRTSLHQVLVLAATSRQSTC